MKLSSTQQGTIIALSCAVIFGIYPAAIRAVYADGGSPIFVMIVTCWARAAVLVGFCLIRRRALWPTRETRRLALSGGVMQAISIYGLTSALEYLPGPLVLIILFTHTLMLLLYMAWRGEAKLDRWTVLTTLSALFGLTLVLDIWHVQAGNRLFGMALAFMAALATVSRLYVFGKQTQTRNPAVVGAETFIIAALLLSGIGLVQVPHAPVMAGSYVYLAIACASMAIGTLGMFYGIALLGSFRWSLFLKLEPVFTALFSFLLLGELLKPQQYVGMALVLVSLVGYQIAAYRRSVLPIPLQMDEHLDTGVST